MRSQNLVPTIEHEFLFHGILGLYDYGSSAPGSVETNLNRFGSDKVAVSLPDP